MNSFKVIVLLMMLCVKSQFLSQKNVELKDLGDKQVAWNYYNESQKKNVDTEKAKELLLKSHNAAKLNNLDSLMLLTSIGLSWYYFSHPNSVLNEDTALYYLKLNQKLFKNIKLINEEVKNNTILSAVYIDKVNLDTALHYISLSDTVIAKNKDELDHNTLQTHYFNKFHLLIDFMRYEEALNLIEVIERNTKKINTSFEYSKLQTIKARIYKESGDNLKNIEYLKKAVKYFKDSSLGTLVIYMDLGDAYKEVGNIDSSFIYYKKALYLCVNHHPYLTNTIYFDLVELFIIKQPELAKIYLAKLDTAQIKNQLPCQFSFLKAKITDNLKQKENLCLNAIKCNPRLEIKKSIYQYLVDVFTNESESKSSIYFVRLTEVKGSLALKKREAEIQKATLRKKLKEKDTLLNKVKIDLENNQKRTYYISYGVIFLIGLLLFISIFYFKKQRGVLSEKSNLINEINNKTKLLEEAYFSNQKSIEFIKRTKKSIDKVSGLENLYAETNLYLKQIEKNKEFNKAIGEVKDEFFNSLQSKFTKTEKNIIILLRIELSSKEIADVLNVKVSSVEKYRYNIRKKFNLEPKQSLVNYIKSL